MNHHIPLGGRKSVFGSGVGYGSLPVIDENWKFYAVRGPMSAQRLGLDPKVAVTDAAILIRKLYPPGAQKKRHKVSFMPHQITDLLANWQPICDALGLHYISPRAPLERVLADLDQSERLVTEAMHGAIVADAFRVPWKPVIFYDKHNQNKWVDWCQSMELTYVPARLDPLSELEAMQSPLHRLKNQTKRALAQTGAWPRGWSGPLPRDTAPEVRQPGGRCNTCNLAPQGPTLLSAGLALRVQLPGRARDRG